MLLALALPAALVQAQTPTVPYDEAEAQAIDRMIMCPVCPAESIDQAQVPLARQMRQLVREKLAQGATRQEILDFFADTYGPDILALPPKSGVNLLAWVLPIAGVLAALAAGLVALRSMTTNRAAATVTTASGPAGSGPLEPDLAPYLAAVDRQLDLASPTADPGQRTDASDSGAGSVESPGNTPGNQRGNALGKRQGDTLENTRGQTSGPTPREGDPETNG
jgi:cytochrome c-type biogenesis protein CcmH